ASEEVRREAEALAMTTEADWKAAEKDRRLLARLLDVSRPREALIPHPGNSGVALAWVDPDADEQFAAAFRDWGLDVDATPTEDGAAGRGGRRAGVRAEVVTALGRWASQRAVNKRPAPSWRRLLDLAEALDRAPGSRRHELWQLVCGGSLERER